MPILLYLALLTGFGPPQKTSKETVEKPDAQITHIPVEAIVVSDDDEQLPGSTTPDQVKAWLADANIIYKPAKIQFDFRGDDSDFLRVKSSPLNHALSEQDSNFALAAQAGNALAAKFPDKMALIFRHGASVIPTGRGVGSIEYDFVLLPSFDVARICEHQNLHFAAQQIGKYLGIKPTAARDFVNTAEAEQFLLDHKNDAACFDGDGIKDTPPDPFIMTIEGICQPTGTVTIGDTDFTLPVGNLMSDYDSAKSLSQTQIKWVQWAAKTRLKNAMGTPTNRVEPTPFKADKLPIAAKHDCEASLQILKTWNATRWNDNSQLLCAAKKAGSLTLTFTVAEEDEYRLALYATQAPDFGIVQIYFDEKPLGKPFDWWAPYVMPTGKLELGQLPLKKGLHRLRFEATDKCELSTDYHFGLDGLTVQAVEK